MEIIILLIIASICAMFYIAYKSIMWVFQPLIEYVDDKEMEIEEDEIEDVEIEEEDIEEPLYDLSDEPSNNQKPQESFVVKLNNTTVLFRIDLVKCDLQPKPKNYSIKDMVSLFVKSGMVKDGRNFYRKLLERENIASTGIGKNIAIPYTTCDAQEDIVVAVGISKTGVEFDSLDEEPVKIIFMSAHNKVSMETIDTGAHLNWLATISRFLSKENIRDALINAKSEEEVFNYLKMGLPHFIPKTAQK